MPDESTIIMTVKECEEGRANIRYASPWHIWHVTFEETDQVGLSDTPMTVGQQYHVIMGSSNPTKIAVKYKVTALGDGVGAGVAVKGDE